ncbi:unnamed protein product [Ixodes pacificus]
MRNVLPQRNKTKSLIYVWDFSRADDVSILDYLELSLCAFDGAMDVNCCKNLFQDVGVHVVNYGLERFVSKRIKFVRKKKNWINREII